jgi:hypothetical protein
VSGHLHAPAALPRCIGGWVGPGAVFDAVVKGKISTLPKREVYANQNEREHCVSFEI